MAIKIVRFSQVVPEEPSGISKISKELIGTGDESTSLNNGAVHVIFIPENLPRCFGLRSSIGECLWSDKSNFRNLFAKEIYKVVRHVRTPSLTIVLQHKTMGGELLTVQYRMSAHEMEGLAGMPAPEDGSDTVFDLCLDITDRMVLQLIDSMSFNIKPSYTSIDTTKPVVPYDDAVDNFASWRNLCDGTAPDRLQSAVDDMKSELEVIKDQMYSMARVPADCMNQDYIAAKDILDGKFDKYLGRDKKADKSEVRGDSTALPPLRPNTDDIKSEFDSMRNKLRALAKRSDGGEDSMFKSSKSSWI